MITSSVNGQLAEKLRHTYVTGQGQRSTLSAGYTEPILLPGFNGET